MNKRPEIGQRVAVQCAVGSTDETTTKYGVVDAVSNANDRPFRVSVSGDDGEYWQECAPECVRVIDVKTLVHRLENAAFKEGKAEYQHLSGQGLERLCQATKAARQELVAEIERVRSLTTLLERNNGRLREVLKEALEQTGCDGDLCNYRWHEKARVLLGE